MTDVPLPEPQPEPARGTGLLYRLQPTFTLIIAFAAIGLATWEGLENRRHNRLSVQPRLGAEIDMGRNPDGEYVRMAVESNGLGPVVVRSFDLYLDGELQDSVAIMSPSFWENAIASLAPSDIQVNAQAIGPGNYFPPGRHTVLFEALRPRTDSAAPPLAGLLDHIAIHICYCSIYDSDCDEVVLATVEPPIERCYRDPDE